MSEHITSVLVSNLAPGDRIFITKDLKLCTTSIYPSDKPKLVKVAGIEKKEFETMPCSFEIVSDTGERIYACSDIYVCALKTYKTLIEFLKMHTVADINSEDSIKVNDTYTVTLLGNQFIITDGRKPTDPVYINLPPDIPDSRILFNVVVPALRNTIRSYNRLLVELGK